MLFEFLDTSFPASLINKKAVDHSGAYAPEFAKFDITTHNLSNGEQLYISLGGHPPSCRCRSDSSRAWVPHRDQSSTATLHLLKFLLSPRLHMPNMPFSFRHCSRFYMLPAVRPRKWNAWRIRLIRADFHQLFFRSIQVLAIQIRRPFFSWDEICCLLVSAILSHALEKWIYLFILSKKINQPLLLLTEVSTQQRSSYLWLLCTFC